MEQDYHKNYYLKNKDRMNETLRVWKENNKEHLKKYRREYYREYNRKKKEKEKFVNKILAINMCLTEAYLEGNKEDILTFKNILTKAVTEALEKGYSNGGK